MTPIKAIAAAAIAIAASQAQAISFTVTEGAFSSVAGVVTDTFDGDATISLNVSGGGFFPQDGVIGVSARPPGSTGQWWSVGTSSLHSTAGSVLLNAPATYYGFLWGSPDGFNTVSFFSNGTMVGSFTGAEVFPIADGNQGAVAGGQYVNFWAGEGEQFDTVKFYSDNDAFETDNHAVFAPRVIEIDNVPAVPEPETYALLLAGLCAVGFMSRNRRAS